MLCYSLLCPIKTITVATHNYTTLTTYPPQINIPAEISGTDSSDTNDLNGQEKGEIEGITASIQDILRQYTATTNVNNKTTTTAAAAPIDHLSYDTAQSSSFVPVLSTAALSHIYTASTTTVNTTTTSVAAGVQEGSEKDKSALPTVGDSVVWRVNVLTKTGQFFPQAYREVYQLCSSSQRVLIVHTLAELLMKSSRLLEGSDVYLMLLTMLIGATCDVYTNVSALAAGYVQRIIASHETRGDMSVIASSILDRAIHSLLRAATCAESVMGGHTTTGLKLPPLSTGPTIDASLQETPATTTTAYGSGAKSRVGEGVEFDEGKMMFHLTTACGCVATLQQSTITSSSFSSSIQQFESKEHSLGIVRSLQILYYPDLQAYGTGRSPLESRRYYSNEFLGSGSPKSINRYRYVEGGYYRVSWMSTRSDDCKRLVRRLCWLLAGHTGLYTFFSVY